MTSLEEAGSVEEAVLLERLFGAARVLVNLLAQSLSKRSDEITPSQFNALLVLADGGGPRSIELIEALGIDPSTTTRLCDRLLARGLIHRERSEVSGGEIQLSPSRTGRALIDSIARDRLALFTNIARTVPLQQRAALMAALDVLLSSTSFESASSGDPELRSLSNCSLRQGSGAEQRSGARGYLRCQGPTQSSDSRQSLTRVAEPLLVS